MNYYSQLLTTVFRVIGNADPQILALTYSATDDEAREDGHTGHYEFPATSMPAGSLVREISGGDQFNEKCSEIVDDSGADCVFAFPPLVPRHLCRREWNDPREPLEMAEKLATALLDGIEGHSEHQRQARQDREPSPAELLDDPKVQRATGSLSNLKCLVMLVPNNFATSRISSRWRRDFFPAHSTVVIEHSHADVPTSLGMVNINPAIRFTTIIFQRDAGPIRFFKISEAAVAEGPEKIAKDLGQLLRQPAGKTRYGYVYQGALDEGYPCSYDYYSEETEKLRQEVAVLGEKVRLGDVADVLRGFTPVSSRQTDAGEIGFLSICGRDITPDGRVELAEVRSEARSAVVRNYLQDGDFCVRQTTSVNGRLAMGIFEGDGRQITAAPSVIIVRPHPMLTPAQRQVLLSYLRSPMGYRLAGAKQSFPHLQGAVRVDSRILADFPVPIADPELSSSIEQLNAARSAFGVWIEEIDRESNSIIEEATAAGSRKRLLSAGRLARQRHRAGEQVEELDYRIRTQFPHPLAYAWRKLQVAGNDRYHRLDAVLKAAENHTCFLALVAILISRSVGQPIKYVDEIAKRLSERKSGTNFGDWLAILQELNNGKAFRSHKSAMPFAEIAELHADSAWPEAIGKLKVWRDDVSHGRISTTSVQVALLAGAEAALEQVYRSTEFLTDYRLMFITETRFNSIHKTNRFQYSDLTGDNSLAQRREGQSERADLESQSLYLMDRQGQLHLFRPLLHYLECPECHLMSTFHLDTYDAADSRDVVGLKSFETNSVRKESIAEDFRHVGLLPR